MVEHARDVYGSEGSVPNQIPVDGTGAGRLSVQADPNAFGAQIGQGVESLGNTVEGIAKEFGDIYNDTAARDRVVQNSAQLGNLFEKYRQNKGLNAADAYKDFQQQATQLYKEGGQGLSLGASKMYQDQFAPIMDRSLKDGGAWAADQTYAAQNQSLDAGIGNNINLMATSGGDPNEMQRLSKGIHDMSIQRAHADGLPLDAAAALTSKNVGAGWAATISTVMKTDPEKAQQLYQSASTGAFTIPMQDGTSMKIPYMDAAQQAQTAREMKQISEQQERQTLYDARSYAMSGAEYDKNAVAKAMRVNGKSPDDINAETTRLNSIQSNFGMASHRYDVEKTLNNNNALMMQGLPITRIDPNYVRSVFPKEPDMAQDKINENNNQHIVSSVVGQFPTQTAQQRQETLQNYRPAAVAQSTLDSALSTVLKHEGGYVPQDGASGAPAIYGINQKWHPTEYAEAKKISDEQGDTAGKQYAAAFYKKNYYDAKGIASLPENTQSIVMDGVVNHTVDFGNKLIQAAKDGSTPQQLIDMRRGEYQRLATSNPKDYAGSLKAWNERLDDLQNTGSGDFVTKQRLYSTLQNAEINYTKRLNDDPSGTLAQADPILMNALNDGIKDPTKLGPFIDSSLKRQEAVEIPEDSRSALPTSVATSFANSIMSDPESAPAAINQLAQKTGEHWPDVYHSMVTQGGLPSTYQSIAMMGSQPETEKYGTLLARWIGSDDTKGKQTAELIGGTKAESDIKAMVQADQGVMNFMTSIARSGASKKQSNDTMDAINSLAYSEVYYNRMGTAEAAQEAIKAFTSRFEFMPNGGARVPAQSFDAVSANAQGLLDNLEKTAVAPPIAQLKYHGLPGETDYFNHTKAAPTWITAPKGDSLLLKDPWGGLVRGKDGKPLSVPFSAPVSVAQPQAPIDLSGG